MDAAIETREKRLPGRDENDHRPAFRSLSFLFLSAVFFGDLAELAHVTVRHWGSSGKFGPLFLCVGLAIVVGYLTAIGLIRNSRDIASDDSIETKPWFSIKSAMDSLAIQGTNGLEWLAIAVGALLFYVDHLLTKLGQ
jgi:hypothetical protein